MKIKQVILDGFKSFRHRTEVAFGDLTLLAGANSSGKSTVVQTLLLMKQTLESSFDPGPLLISGPNVTFANTEQMFWSAPGETKEELTLGVFIGNGAHNSGYEVRLKKLKGIATPLQIVSATFHSQGRQWTLTPQLSKEQQAQFSAQFQQRFGRHIFPKVGEGLQLDFQVQRDRFFLFVTVKLLNPESGEVTADLGRLFPDYDQPQPQIEKIVRGIIHVPALRGNPRRTYPVSAVEQKFPGLFYDYVASIIALWQETDPKKIGQLNEDLREIGLTWNVKARKVSDTEVEIQVGRLPESIKPGTRDLVSIADAGFGLSQVLPVAVALLASEPGQMVYLEQPEIHLHPRAEYRLARLIQRAVKRGVQVVVETHSELLLLGLQELVAKKQLREKSVLLHWVQRDNRGASTLLSQTLDEKGAFGDVPVDFAQISLEAMHNYLNASSG